MCHRNSLKQKRQSHWKSKITIHLATNEHTSYQNLYLDTNIDLQEKNIKFNEEIYKIKMKWVKEK